MSVGSRLRAWAAGLRRHWKRHLGTLALVVAVALAAQLWQTRSVAGGPLPDAAQDAPLPVLAGGALRQSSLRAEIDSLQRAHPGQNIGLYVWADWCPICRTLQGTVNGLNQDHPVITVAMQSGPPEKVARYMASRGLAWLTVVDPQSAIPEALGFGAVPAFAVITPQGELRWPTVGLTSGWGLRLRLWLAS
jgi:thiol-disulfide isomerase/thioredoxin